MLAPLFALVLALTAPPVLGAGAVGLWKTPVDGGLIRLERCGEDLCGRVAGSARLRAFPGQKDARNRDPASRERAIMGLLILKLHPLGPGRWGGGDVYNPDDGGNYKADLQVIDRTHVRLRACVVAPLCPTQFWTRVD